MKRDPRGPFHTLTEDTYRIKQIAPGQRTKREVRVAASMKVRFHAKRSLARDLTILSLH